MREANNGEAVAQKVLEATGIEIEIIGGEIEASIIASTDLRNLIDTEKTFLYVDVGEEVLNLQYLLKVGM